MRFLTRECQDFQSFLTTSKGCRRFPKTSKDFQKMPKDALKNVNVATNWFCFVGIWTSDLVLTMCYLMWVQMLPKWTREWNTTLFPVLLSSKIQQTVVIASFHFLESVTLQQLQVRHEKLLLKVWVSVKQIRRRERGTRVGRYMLFIALCQGNIFTPGNLQKVQ